MYDALGSREFTVYYCAQVEEWTEVISRRVDDKNQLYGLEK